MAQSKTTEKHGLGWLLAIGAFFATKFKWLIAILKFAKFSTLISLFVSLGAYAVFYGWKFAAAIIYLLFVHEMGHLVCARQKGIKTSPAIFIPFMGAVIGMKEKPKTAKDESFIAYGGPLAGLLSVLPALVLYMVTQHEFWALVILVGAMLNLFNLIPVTPLDGGRILSVVSTKIWFLGLLIMVIFLIFNFHAIIVLILIFGIQAMLHQHKERTQLEIDRYDMQRTKELIGKVHALREKYETSDPITFSWFLESEFQNTKSNMEEINHVHIPWYSSERRLKRGKWRVDKATNHTYYQLLKIPRIEEDEKRVDASLQEALEEQHRHIEKLRQGVEAGVRYYQATTKEKFTALVAYLTLGAVLAGLWWHGEQLLNGVQTF